MPASPEKLTDQPSSSAVDFGSVALGAIVVIVLAALGYRMSVGVDLTDESYYISFIDGWLKTGLGASDALVIHQTAELLVFPLAKLFAWATGGVGGLALFLRYVYLCASCLAGLCFYSLARTLHGRAMSTLAGLFVTAFIPFSLPAPSYNTLGMLGMICALSTFGVYTKHRAMRFAVFSAFAWMVAVMAYPTLLVVLFASLLGAWAIRANRSRNRLWTYVLLCLAMQALGLLVLLVVYGPDRLSHIIAFTNASLQVSNGVSAKITRAATMLMSHRWFPFLCGSSVVTGCMAAVMRDAPARDWAVTVATVATLGGAWAAGPVLYAQSHDYVFLLCLGGAAFFAMDFLAGRHAAGSTLRLLFAVAFFGGLVTSITATNGLVNFPVGGFMAAAIYLLAFMPHRNATGTVAHATRIAAAGSFLLASSFTFVYGEPVNPLTTTARRIDSGVFAGLLTTETKRDDIRRTSTFLAGIPGNSLAVLGRFPGIYLLTAMKPKALTTWDFGQQNGAPPKAEAIIEKYYRQPQNEPSVVLRVSDPWTKPPSASGRQLLSDYAPSARLDLGLWRIQAFERATHRSLVPPVREPVAKTDRHE